MTSKTFKSFLGESGSRRLHVERRPEGSNLWVSDNSWGDDYGITIAPSDAPALCLAILEAAGAESAYRSAYNAGSDWQLEHAVNELSEYVRTRSTYEAESRERAELEAEAFNLYRAYMAVHEPLNAIGGWHMLAEHTKEKWLAVARRAREMRAEK